VPFNGKTYDPACTYIAAYCHPMDVHFSPRKLVENRKIDLLQDHFPGDISDTFRMLEEDGS